MYTVCVTLELCRI